MTIWFSADLHLGHKNIIKYCNRPFESIEQMDETIMNNFRSLVRSQDIIYFIGDVCFKGPSLKEYFLGFECKKFLMIGNHDPAQIPLGIFSSIKEVKMIKINNQPIWLSHYAHRAWPMSFHGSWHLFGHTHGRLPDYGLSLDVGVDCWNYKPVSFEQISEVLSKREIIKV